MTPSQERAVARIRNTVNMDDYTEIKEFDVVENEFFVDLVVTIGKKGEEDAFDRLLNRKTIQLFIGKHGGITYPIFKKDKYATKKYDSFYKTVKDQELLNAF